MTPPDTPTPSTPQTKPTPTSTPQASELKRLMALTPEEAGKELMADPIGMMTTLISELANDHLMLLAQQLELQAALEVARRSQPDFAQFEPMILQELSALIANDEDGVLDPWPSLIERATAKFASKLEGVLKQHPELAQAGADKRPHMEGAEAKPNGTGKQRYSRQAIESMSLEEFLNNEEAINNALRHNRIL
jgi:hypothetical protein